MAVFLRSASVYLPGTHVLLPGLCVPGVRVPSARAQVLS